MMCFLFKKWVIPASFWFIFVFSNKHYIFYNKYMWKNVHPVYSTGIRTHDLQDMSLHPKPLDQGSRPNMFVYLELTNRNMKHLPIEYYALSSEIRFLCIY